MQAEAKQPTKVGFFVFYCPEKAPNVPRRTWLFASNLPRVLADDPLPSDLHVHDLCHKATRRLAEKLQLHELMKVTGHKGTVMLARYYPPRAEDLAKKLG